MLVIARCLREKVLFPSINFSVQVVSTKQGVVHLGIEAPPDVAIFRQEVLDRILGQANAPEPECCPRSCAARHTSNATAAARRRADRAARHADGAEGGAARPPRRDKARRLAGPQCDPVLRSLRPRLARVPAPASFCRSLAVRPGWKRLRELRRQPPTAWPRSAAPSGRQR
jgi:carbon storage regulator CsrA